MSWRTNRRTGKRFKSSRYSPAAREYISKKIRYLIDEEGRDQQQAIAQAHEMARKRGFKVPPRRKGNPGENGWDMVGQKSYRIFSK